MQASTTAMFIHCFFSWAHMAESFCIFYLGVAAAASTLAGFAFSSPGAAVGRGIAVFDALTLVNRLLKEPMPEVAGDRGAWSLTTREMGEALAFGERGWRVTRILGVGVVDMALCLVH